MINYSRKADQLIPAVWWWWCRSGRGGSSTIAFSQVTAPHHVSVEEQEQRWRHDNYLHWQQGSRQDRSRRHGNTLRLCRDNLPKWMRKSVWPGQKSFNVKILNYLCVEVIWFLSRSIMFCLLSDANTWHCSYKSVHSRCFCDNRQERARAQASCDTLHLGAGAWAPPTGTQQHSMER